MMKEKLNPLHVAILIYNIQVGVVLFSLPRLLADSFGTNGWIMLLVLSLFVMINIYLISKVYQLAEGDSLFDILRATFPKWILAPFYVYIASIWALLACLVTKQFVLIVKMISFPTTSPALFKGMAALLAFLLILKGPYNMVKAATISFFITIWTVFLTIFHFDDFEWIRLTPFFLQGDIEIISGSLETYSAFLGYELILLFFGYVENQKTFFLAVYIGNLMTTAVYLLVSIISFGFFGFELVKVLLFPILELLGYIELPFVERIENVVFSIFIAKVVITTAFYYYAAQQTIVQLFSKIKPSIIAFFIILITYLISFTVQTLENVQSLLTYFSYHGMAIAWGLPIVLIISLLVKKRRRIL